MTQNPRSAQQPSRRSVLRALGAVPVAAAGGLAASSAATAAAPVSSSGKGSVPKDLRPDGRLDRFVAERAARDEFSGTVLVAHRGEAILTRSHGMADKERSIPNRPDTIFNLASVTKSFTALAVMQLAERNELGLFDELGTYLDGFPPGPAAAKVHELLTHRSGIGRDATGEGVGMPVTWDSVDEVWDGVLAAIRAIDETRFPPGSDAKYSNDGYWLLGAIVAEVSGDDTFYDYVRRHIFDAADMQGADFYTRTQVRADRDIAHQYALNRETGQRFDFTMGEQFAFVGGPDGGAYSSAEDLLRFATALQENQLLNRPFTDLATRGKFPRPLPSGAAYSHGWAGYGFHDYVYAGHRIYGHDGGGPGAGAYYDVFPDLDWVTVVVSNYDDTPTIIQPIIHLARELIIENA